MKDIPASVKLSLGTWRWPIYDNTESCRNYELPLITVPPKFKLPKDLTRLVLVVEKSKDFIGIHPANIDDVDGVICKIPSCRQEPISCTISESAAFQYNKCNFSQACFSYI
uniref:Peptidase S1 domain-containing protein n=1 Tax=Panagrellus redivivus TaxID=6233 RepID=A0A7E4W3F5_PANRE